MELFEQIAGMLFLALLTPLMLVFGIFVTMVAAVEAVLKNLFRKYL